MPATLVTAPAPKVRLREPHQTLSGVVPGAYQKMSSRPLASRSPTMGVAALVDGAVGGVERPVRATEPQLVGPGAPPEEQDVVAAVAVEVTRGRREVAAHGQGTEGEVSVRSPEPELVEAVAGPVPEHVVAPVPVEVTHGGAGEPRGDARGPGVPRPVGPAVPEVVLARSGDVPEDVVAPVPVIVADHRTEATGCPDVGHDEAPAPSAPPDVLRLGPFAVPEDVVLAVAVEVADLGVLERTVDGSRWSARTRLGPAWDGAGDRSAAADPWALTAAWSRSWSACCRPGGSG